jgi:hypothetical protein
MNARGLFPLNRTGLLNPRELPDAGGPCWRSALCHFQTWALAASYVYIYSITSVSPHGYRRMRPKRLGRGVSMCTRWCGSRAGSRRNDLFLA